MAATTPTVVTSPTASASEAARPTPSATIAAGAPASDSPKPVELVVQLQDLPEGLLLVASDESDPDGFSVVYLNPLAPSDSPAVVGKIVGVVANVSLHADATTAQRAFNSQGNLTSGAVIGEILGGGAEPGSVDAQELAAKVPDVDRQLVFRVRYTLNGTRLHEYRYRVISGPAVANVIVTARALQSGSEPASLRADSLRIVGTQVERLRAAFQ